MSTTQVDSDLSNRLLGQLGLPIFIITTFFPQIAQWLVRHPRIARILSLPLALWFGYEFLLDKTSVVWHNLMSTFMSSVTISSQDTELYSSFMALLATKHLSIGERHLSAASTQFLRNQNRHKDKRLGPGQNILFEAQNKFQFFWHNRRLFVFTAEKCFKPSHARNVTIRTFGFSPDSITQMLSESYKKVTEEDGKILTQIYVPYDRCREWIQRCAKPRRPLSSVYLPEAQKKCLLKDISEYLDEKNVRWHEDRSIPRRRGYLFHGLPGTGKTTLALAIAGHFQLKVYMLSLLDKYLNDNTLLDLMQSIGPGTMLLLEDVDCAGLGRRSTKSNTPKFDSEGHVLEEEVARVSLSGLLNAIDGAGAPEGHILVMTTNEPDSLDEALVRAGRIDTRVEFKNATYAQARDIFNNMYMPITLVPEGADSTYYAREEESQECAKSLVMMSEPEDEAQQGEPEDQKQKEKKEIEMHAEVFAGEVPEGMFSPAELQGYIMLHRDKPKEAVEGVKEWVRAELEEKNKHP